MELFSGFAPKQKIESFNLSSDGFQIQSRNVGIVGAITSAMGIGAKSHLDVDPRGAAIRTSNLSGQTRSYIPLSSISATVYRYGSPVGLLGAGVTFGFIGLPGLLSGGDPSGIIFMVLAAICVAAFFFSPKTVTIGIITSAGTADTLRLEAKGPQIDELRKASEWLERAAANAGVGRPDQLKVVETATAAGVTTAPTGHSVKGSSLRS